MKCARSSTSDVQFGEQLIDTKSNILRQGLSLLTSVMIGHDGNKSDFGKILTSGLQKDTLATNSTKSNKSSKKYLTSENFRSMLLHVEPIPTAETIVVLFEMLLDSPCGVSKAEITSLENGLFAENDDDRPKIKNPTIIFTIFQLLVHCRDEVQMFILNTFQNLLTGRASLVNLSICSQTEPRLLDLGLNIFPEITDEVQVLNVKLIQTLGNHNISVAQLKHLFCSLQSKQAYRPSYTWRVLKVSAVVMI
jgi:hypothetical protein